MEFVVKKKDLAAHVEEKPRSRMIYELYQNGKDEASTRIDITVEMLPGRPAARVLCIDNSPKGFEDIQEAFTLFAPSKKLNDAEKSGLFNMGEKMVLSLCEWAEIRSVKAAMRFDDNGNHMLRSPKKRTKIGTEFEGVMKMTREQYQEVEENIFYIIPRPHQTVTFNGVEIPHRTPLVTFPVKQLSTVTERVGNKTKRDTIIEVYEPFDGETPMIYEMSIPICPSDMKYHINVLQRVPLGYERDTVTHAYYQDLAAEVVNHTHHLLTEEEAGDVWVRDGITDERATKEAVETVIRKEFGDKIVRTSGDKDADDRARSMGYTVLGGGALGSAWANVDREMVPTSGEMFPVNVDTGIGRIPQKEWTEGMQQVAALAVRLGERVLHRKMRVVFWQSTLKGSVEAAYGHGELIFIKEAMGGNDFFDRWETHLAELLDLLIHEFTHEEAGEHRSPDYHRHATRIGGAVAALIAHEPDIVKPVSIMLTAQKAH